MYKVGQLFMFKVDGIRAIWALVDVNLEKDECTIEYERARLYIDKKEYVYCIEFTGKSEKECIYINRNLATILSVKNPITDTGTESGVN